MFCAHKEYYWARRILAFPFDFDCLGINSLDFLTPSDRQRKMYFTYIFTFCKFRGFIAAHRLGPFSTDLPILRFSLIPCLSRLQRMSSQSSVLEQQNNQRLEELSRKVTTLRNVSIFVVVADNLGDDRYSFTGFRSIIYWSGRKIPRVSICWVLRVKSSPGSPRPWKILQDG